MITEVEGWEIEHWFTHHPPVGGQVAQYERVREAGKVFALVIADDCPPCADRTVAIRKVREAVMTANAAIACKGK